MFANRVAGRGIGRTESCMMFWGSYPSASDVHKDVEVHVDLKVSIIIRPLRHVMFNWNWTLSDCRTVAVDEHGARSPSITFTYKRGADPIFPLVFSRSMTAEDAHLKLASVLIVFIVFL